MRFIHLSVLLVSGCGAAEPPSTVHQRFVPLLPVAGSKVSLPLRLVGTEPFWGVLLKDGSLSFNAVDRGAIVAPIAAVEAQGSATVFRTAPPNGVLPAAVRAVISPGPCSDGMSDRVYPHTAVVEVDHAGAAPRDTFKGCAGPESLFQRPPDP